MKNAKLSSYALTVIFLIIFLFMLYCNLHTGLLTDDYAYFFDFSDDYYYMIPTNLFPLMTAERITSVWQIFTSMSAHRFCMNGRVFAHFGVQLFLLLPHMIFKIVNSLVFTSEILCIYICSVRNLPQDSRFFRVLIPCFAFSCIWIFQPSFGQVNLWLDGSLNYLWASVVTLIYIQGYINLCRTGDFSSSHSRVAAILFVVFSFVAGAYSENSGVACIVFSLGIMLSILFIKKDRLCPYAYASFAATLAGFLFLIKAPAELVQKVSPNLMNISTLAAMLQRVLDTASSFLPLTILCVVLLVLAFLSDVDRNTLIITCTIFVTALAAYGCLVIASYIPRRSLFLTPVLLTLDCSILLTALLREGNRKLAYSIVFALLMLAPSRILSGVIDINRTYEDTSARDKILAECAEAGLKDAYLPPLTHGGYSEYSPANGLLYLSYDADSYPNCYIAKYYGLEHVYLDESDAG